VQTGTAEILDVFDTINVEIIELARFHTVLEALSQKEKWFLDHFYCVS